MKNAYEVIKAPLVTEKNNELAAQKKYVFKVATGARKIEIAQAVESLFNVKVASVNVMNYKGKPKRVGKTNRVSRRDHWKKAVVTLVEGSIDII
ncbi:MAG: 50S ribosomal protein L23 [Victivallaceae bacterium]|nr:50S ribosomal protein L23 [Victivallaceae bacterium]MDD4181586.1 50S ribosomal protein L23 [Victivallaceae bacterium]